MSVLNPFAWLSRWLDRRIDARIADCRYWPQLSGHVPLSSAQRETLTGISHQFAESLDALVAAAPAREAQK